MLITAILAIRNDAPYLANCLRHLVRNEIHFAIIDNDSSDGSAEIYRRREFAAHLVEVRELPFKGTFSLSDQLRSKMAIVKSLSSDWVIHLDVDEEMDSYRQGETLQEGVSRLDAEGWNVINFDEFVFLPIDHEYVPEVQGPQPILHYYFFQPSFPRLMRAWKKTGGFSMAENGGHRLTGSGIKLAPESFALRHYIVRHQEHAFTKYTTRNFDAEDLTRGWHQARHNQTITSFRLPPVATLRKLPFAGQRDLDRSDPWKVHYWKLATDTA